LASAHRTIETNSPDLLETLVAQSTAAICPGRLLVHVSETDVDDELLTLIESTPESGLILWGSGASGLRRTRRRFRGLVGHDAGLWRSVLATPTNPLPGLGDPDELVLVPVDLDQYLGSIAAAGADFVLTPSGFVPAGAWSTLRALLSATARTERRDVLTLVPTDAQMLDPAYRSQLTDELATTGRPLALVFAASSQPFGKPGRVAALRELLATLPGLTVLATEYLVASDVLVRGGTASVGFHRTLRCPVRPTDPDPDGMAKGWLPGLFLRELWENRSPSVYADWYAFRSSSPHCDPCGRDVDDFEPTSEDRLQIRRHNVHALMAVLADLRRSPDPASLLRTERAAALQRHVDLHPFTARHQTDPVLRRLAELDDGHGRQILPSGAWSR
jgi:hypothetical protein